MKKKCVNQCLNVLRSHARQVIADVAELVDALVSGTSGSNVVGVQVSPSALLALLVSAGIALVMI